MERVHFWHLDATSEMLSPTETSRKHTDMGILNNKQVVFLNDITSSLFSVVIWRLYYFSKILFSPTKGCSSPGLSLVPILHPLKGKYNFLPTVFKLDHVTCFDHDLCHFWAETLPLQVVCYHLARDWPVPCKSSALTHIPGWWRKKVQATWQWQYINNQNQKENVDTLSH